jgi:hypothetical protein
LPLTNTFAYVVPLNVKGNVRLTGTLSSSVSRKQRPLEGLNGEHVAAGLQPRSRERHVGVRGDADRVVAVGGRDERQPRQGAGAAVVIGHQQRAGGVEQAEPLIELAGEDLGHDDLTGLRAELEEVDIARLLNSVYRRALDESNGSEMRLAAANVLLLPAQRSL